MKYKRVRGSIKQAAYIVLLGLGFSGCATIGRKLCGSKQHGLSTVTLRPVSTYHGLSRCGGRFSR